MARGPIEQAQMEAIRNLRSKFYPAPPIALAVATRERKVMEPQVDLSMAVAVDAMPSPYRPDEMVVPPAQDPPEPPAEPPTLYRISSVMLEQRTRGQLARDIIRLTAQQHGVTTTDVMGPRRQRAMVAARHEAIWRVSVAFPDMSLPQIGRVFGGRDHTTILHAIGVYEGILRDRGQALYVAERMQWGALSVDDAEEAWDIGASASRKETAKRVRKERARIGKEIRDARMKAFQPVDK